LKIKAISKANFPLTILLSMAFPLLGNAGEFKTHDITYESNPIKLEGIVKSMNGPSDSKTLSVPGASKPELLWITGFTASAYESGTGKARSVGNLCHTGLSIAPRKTRTFSTPNVNPVSQYAVLFPGVSDMSFPQGMGVPFSSDEPLGFMSMGFNQDPNAKIPPQVFKLTLHYVSDADSHGEIRPLFHRMVRLWLPIKGAHGEGCDMISGPSHLQTRDQWRTADQAGYDHSFYFDALASRRPVGGVARPFDSQNRLEGLRALR
jgi:hypothetical protein